MKVVVCLCAVLPFTGWPLLTSPWLLSSITLTAFTAGDQKKWTDLSHHAQLSMCTSRDKMAASGMEFSILIKCEFVAVVSWKIGWLWVFFTKFALVRSDDWRVSLTRPWAVFTRLGRPDKWLVRTLVIVRTNKWLTHRLTDTQTQATTMPGGQNWPRVKKMAYKIL